MAGRVGLRRAGWPGPRGPAAASWEEVHPGPCNFGGERSMSLRLAERSKWVAPSATMAMAAEAARLKATGVEVFDFTLGEPDFPTPENVCRAAERAMREGKTHYTPAAGIPELRAAVAGHYSSSAGLPTDPQ